MMVEQKKFIEQCKKNFYECYKELAGKKVVLFAAGGRAHMIILAFREMNIEADIQAILDNKCEEGICIEGIPVYNAEKIGKFLDCIFIICSDTYREVINQQIKKAGGRPFDIPNWEGMVEQMLTLHEYVTKVENEPIGDIYSWIGRSISEDRIRAVEDKLEDEKSVEVFQRRMELLRDGDLDKFLTIPVDQVEYFDLNELNYTQQEVFVDCGAYIGDTIESYRRNIGKYKKIIAIEPDRYNCKKIQEYIKREQLDNIQVINAAVGNENKMVHFDQQGTAGSAVKDEGQDGIELVRLDDVIKDAVTYLKMDIEGFELEALKGAETLIKINKPKLAICIYHKYDDPVCITEYLSGLVPKYKFYMRHYTYSQHETVLYAIC